MVNQVESALREASNIFDYEKLKFQDEFERKEQINQSNIKMIA